MSNDIPYALLERLASALNSHDVDELIRCFHHDYRSVQPAHPERSFVGQDNVAANWSWVFEHFEDFRATLLDYAVRDCTIWSEWEWAGNDPSGRYTVVRGVMILSVEGDLIVAGRLYMEPVNSAR